MDIRSSLDGLKSLLGVTPPDIDGWSYAEFTAALISIKKENKG